MFLLRKGKLLNFRNTFIFQRTLAYITTILPWTSRSSLTNQKAEQWLFLCLLVITKNPPRGNYASGLVEDSLMQGRVKEETISILQKYYLLLHKHLYCTVITSSLVCLSFDTKSLPWGYVFFNFAF